MGNTTYDVGDPVPGLGQEQKYAYRMLS